ncbi:MAG: aminopeptidase [Bdellovibrionota bacterium]
MQLPYFDKFIDLVLSTGIEMKKDQQVYISFDAALAEYAEQLGAEAYKRGAKYVWFDPKFMKAHRARLDSGTADSCGYLPEFVKSLFDEASQLPWARIHLDGKGDPDLFAGVDGAKSLTADKAARAAAAKFRSSIIRGDMPWSISALPTPKWAALVMGTPEGPETTLAFWEILAKILRLDTPNPSETWRKLSDKLVKRGTVLNEKKFLKLHLEAPGTSLEVELIQESCWQGGSHDNTTKGFRYLANIPTEEVFTSPDWRKTQGRARMTRPVEVMNQIVEGAEFEFKDGKCVNFSAKRGASALESFFNSDPQARYLGEIALVDSTSPIFQSGKTFYSILIDENAACHMAFGGAYPLGVEDKNYTPEELMKHGFNSSIQHTDFMIGCPEMNIHGIHHDGKKEQIMKEGCFINDFA